MVRLRGKKERKILFCFLPAQTNICAEEWHDIWNLLQNNRRGEWEDEEGRKHINHELVITEGGPQSHGSLIFSLIES